MGAALSLTKGTVGAELAGKAEGATAAGPRRWGPEHMARQGVGLFEVMCTWSVGWWCWANLHTIG